MSLQPFAPYPGVGTTDPGTPEDGDSGTGVDVPTAPPRARALESLTVTLSQDGTDLTLTDPWRLQAGVEGLDDVVASVLAERRAGLWGETHAGVDITGRDVFLPLLLRAWDIDEWRAARRALMAVTDPMVGPTRVTVTLADGSSRWIDGRHVPDQRAWSTDQWSHAGWQRMGLVFRCPDPWWRSPVSASLALSGAPRVSWLSSSTPFFPAFLGPGRAPDGEPQTVTVPGDAPMWPTWEIDGAADEITITHVETGRSLTVDLDGVDRPVRIVTDPAAQSVTADGVDAWAQVQPPFDLFPLPPGPQTLTALVVDGDSTTSVVMTGDSAWRTATI